MSISQNKEGKCLVKPIFQICSKQGQMRRLEHEWRKACTLLVGFLQSTPNKLLEDRLMSNKEIIEALVQAIGMELETVHNYLANSVNLDGVRAEEIKKSLAADITAELGHAQQLANRVRVLGGTVPGSFGFKPSQKSLQPPAVSTDVVSVIKGVLEAEESAIQHYKRIIGLCEGKDYVTQDLCVTLLGDEEEHRREFAGFLVEYERKS
jgi:bacterioferritin